MTETPYLARRIRAVANGQAPLSDLRQIAVMVERQERFLDNLVGEACAADEHARRAKQIAAMLDGLKQ